MSDPVRSSIVRPSGRAAIDADYIADATDHAIGVVGFAAGPITVRLPPCSEVGPTEAIIIADESLQCGPINTITVHADSGFDGGLQDKIINQAGGAVVCYSTGRFYKLLTA